MQAYMAIVCPRLRKRNEEVLGHWIPDPRVEAKKPVEPGGKTKVCSANPWLLDKSVPCFSPRFLAVEGPEESCIFWGKFSSSVLPPLSPPLRDSRV